MIIQVDGRKSRPVTDEIEQALKVFEGLATEDSPEANRSPSLGLAPSKDSVEK